MFLLLVKTLAFMDGKVYVWLYDGASQHLSALTYYSGYLREIIKGIFHGDLSFPRWDLAIGEGSDILTTFHYYCIGDPLTLICVFFPEKMMFMCYELLIYIRVFLTGLSFMFFVKVFDGGRLRERIKDITYVSGTVLYTFSAWLVMLQSRHPFFVNPMIYLPLILACVELLMKKKKRGFMAIAVMLCSLSNLYFFYIIALLTVIYVAVRMISIHKNDVKSIAKGILPIATEAVIGLLMSCAVFYPVARVFLSDSRVGGDNNVGFFYPLKYYLQLPQAFMSGYWSYYLFIGVGAIGVCVIYFAFSRRGYKALKVIMALMIIFMIFPFFGNILNGFAYASNRWAFAIPLVCGFALVVLWDEIMEIKKKDVIILSVIFCIFMASSIYYKDTAGIIMTSLGIVLFIALLVVKNKDLLERFVFATVILSSMSLILVYNTGFLDQLAPSYWLDIYYFGSEAQHIAGKGDSNPVRYSGDILTENISPIAGVSSTQFYWSNANPYVGEFRTDIASHEYRLYYYSGYNASSVLLDLSACKYYAQSDIKRNPIPYGYTAGEHIDSGYTIYTNDLPVSLVYSYDQSVSKDYWDNLSPAQRQILMTKAVVTDDDKADLKNVDIDPVKLDCEVEKNDEGAVIRFEGRPGCETYLTFKGLKSDKVDEFIYFYAALPETGEWYPLEFYTMSNWYNGRDCFTLNLGWHEEAVNEIVLTVNQPTIYTCDFEVSTIDVAETTDNISALLDNSPEVINTEDRGTVISFDTDSDTSKYYVLATPYSSKWTCSIDGEDAKVLQANIQYMAVKVSGGHHTVRFEYKGDYDTGIILSVVGVLVFAGYMICGKIRKDKLTGS